ncbi:hypothetical protein GQ54DRAFT_34592 [Martensiomyces pterosporus]|nr:hypothetical protein GQ54DRAFT_34592 [Martensiomyces pterosporus]
MSEPQQLEVQLAQRLDLERARARRLETENSKLHAQIQSLLGSRGAPQAPSSSSYSRGAGSKGDDNDFDRETIEGSEVRRTSSVESDFAQAATIPARSAKLTRADSRSRPKSHSRHSAKFVASVPQQHQHQHQHQHQPQQAGTAVPVSASAAAAAAAAVPGSSSSEATIVELQQRLETMAREKVSLESAIEQEQERMFNQGRRLSGSISPTPFMPIGVGLGGGAVSPRWPNSHSRSSSVSSFGGASVSSVGITESLKADINSLRLKLADAERELVSCYHQSQIYKKELVSLRQRLGMNVDDLYLDDPVPSTLKTSSLAESGARPRRSQSVSSGVSSTGSTPSLARRGSGHQHEYFSMLPSTATIATPRRSTQRPRSVLLSPRRSMEDHQGAGNPAAGFTAAEQASLFSFKPGAPHHSSHRAATRAIK